MGGPSCEVVWLASYEGTYKQINTKPDKQLGSGQLGVKIGKEPLHDIVSLPLVGFAPPGLVKIFPLGGLQQSPNGVMGRLLV